MGSASAGRLYAFRLAQRPWQDGCYIEAPMLLRFHPAMVKRKYRLLYGPTMRSHSSPKSPSKDLVNAVVEMKRRNPGFGCRKIAEQISDAFGMDVHKDVIRR